MFKKILVLTLFSMIAFSLIYAEEATDIAKTLVADAAKYLNENGRDAALKEISNPKGRFVKDSVYVFAYDIEAVCIAHPLKPELIGKNLMNEPDSKGKLFRKEIVELAKAKGEGWVDYAYINPETGKEDLKTTYVLKAGDIVLCCGVYKSCK